MANFKEMLANDLKNVFYNTNEFAEVNVVEYDGLKKDIPVIFDYDGMKERTVKVKDHAEGLFLADLIIRINLADWGDTMRKGHRVYLDDDMYTIMQVDSEGGEMVISLECVDE